MVSKMFPPATMFVAASLMLSCAGNARPMYEKLHDFVDDGSDGFFPMNGLIAYAGALYGTTGEGGTSGAGTVYKVDPNSGGVTVLHSFDQTDGFEPISTLARREHTLYGTTIYGGARKQGTLFDLDALTGAFTTLYPFHGRTGRFPYSGVTYQSGMLYGTTHGGGDLKHGTAYAFDPASGTQTVLHDFGTKPDGNRPDTPPIFVASALYGVTVAGGAFGHGTVYTLDPASGAETIVYNFGREGDGAYPAGIVAQGDTLFGATAGGGAHGLGTIFTVDLATGSETVLLSFTEAEGDRPAGAPIVHGGALYGMTGSGGKARAGVVYRFGLKDGAFSKLHVFADAPDGAVPFGSLLFYRGAFYGTTSQGGVNGGGTVFRVTP
jgi:uncharacterized repeat protein (TIGR03803 family)